MAPELQSEIFKELSQEDVKYSLIVDESTDVSCQKHLCVCVRYFSISANDMKTVFLGLIPVTSTTGEDLFQAISKFMADRDIKLVNCIGFASDDASNMVGAHNSVWSRLKAAAPQCILSKCVCHSLALCAQHAFGKLPSNLEYMLHEIPKWFRNSNLRREEYQAVFDVMRGEDDDVQPTPYGTKMSEDKVACEGKSHVKHTDEPRYTDGVSQ